MAKESIKAREVKKQKLVAKYATKRAALKAAGDWVGLSQLPKLSKSEISITNSASSILSQHSPQHVP